MADLLESLEHTRADYDQEQEWHAFLLDSYSGSGGFSGAVVQPAAGYWGAAAEVYSGAYKSSGSDRLTYLDRFPREELTKFSGRIDVAHHAGYIQALTDLKTSFMLNKPLTVRDRPDAVIQWREDVDGQGTTWDEVLPDLVLRAATVGWLPVVIDMPPAPADENGVPLQLTRADADALGLRPTVVPLFPANLTDYSVDHTGTFEWAKIRTDHQEQPDPFGPVLEVTRYTIWFPDRFEQYEVGKEKDGTRSARLTHEATHDFGEVPIAIFPHKSTLDDPVKGLPMHGQESVEARRLFNAHSELDEHLRSQVFAVLVLAAEENEEGGEVTIGTTNGIYLAPDASQKHYYMSPDASVAAAYETRIENIVQEIYRQARVEFTRPSSSRQAVSGIARKFEFAQTNAALAVFAKGMARFEEHVDWLVGKALGVDEDELQKEKITAPDSFDVEDLQESLQIAMDAITGLQVGPTAERLLRGRVVQQLIPDPSDEDAAAIEEELAGIANQQLQEEQINAEIAAALESETGPPGNLDGGSMEQPENA